MPHRPIAQAAFAALLLLVLAAPGALAQEAEEPFVEEEQADLDAEAPEEAVLDENDAAFNATSIAVLVVLSVLVIALIVAVAARRR